MTAKEAIAKAKKDMKKAKALYENLKKEYDEQQKFVTVKNKFRGSLKLDFWVRDNKAGKWKLIEDHELLARADKHAYPFILYSPDDLIVSFKYLKFKKFSEENLRLINWLVDFHKERS